MGPFGRGAPRGDVALGAKASVGVRARALVLSGGGAVRTPRHDRVDGTTTAIAAHQRVSARARSRMPDQAPAKW